MDNALLMASGLAIVGLLFGLVVWFVGERQDRQSKHR
jgi:hypothetical protein